jgi:1-deoxyxylulose-5-phosphate synthase
MVLRQIAMQDQYNLIKWEQREMLPMCADMGVGCVPPQVKGQAHPSLGT